VAIDVFLVSSQFFFKVSGAHDVVIQLPIFVLPIGELAALIINLLLDVHRVHLRLLDEHRILLKVGLYLLKFSLFCPSFG